MPVCTELSATVLSALKGGRRLRVKLRLQRSLADDGGSLCMGWMCGQCGIYCFSARNLETWCTQNEFLAKRPSIEVYSVPPGYCWRTWASPMRPYCMRTHGCLFLVCPRLCHTCPLCWLLFCFVSLCCNKSWLSRQLNAVFCESS